MQVCIADDALAIACGAEDVATAFSRHVPEASLVRTSSWGMHWLEPLVVIDGTGYGPCTADDVELVVAHARGQVPDSKVTALCIGTVAEHPWLTRQQRLTFARAGLTRPLSLEDYKAHGGWTGLERARSVGPEATVQEVTESGLRGRGGAGFPTGIKWKTVADTSADQKYIVCNADEGDSGTFADRALMEGDPYCLLEGMAIAGHAVGASRGYIYVRSEYPHAIAKLEKAIDLAADLLHPFALEVRVGAGSYVCGEETALLNSLEGKRGEVRAKPPLPAHEGLFGKPTVVNNVLSLGAVPFIMAEGAKAYAQYGMGRSRGTTAVQLAGNIRHGGLFETAFGITLGELVDEIGGGTASGRPVRAVQVGGPLGAYLPRSQFHLPFDYEAFAEADALIGHAGVVVFDDTVDMLAQARFAMEFCAAESCGKCTPCRIGAVRGMETLDRLITNGRKRDIIELSPQMHNAPTTPRTRADEIYLVRDLCETMKFGSLCALGGFTPYPVISALTHFPEDFDVLVAQVAE